MSRGLPIQKQNLPDAIDEAATLAVLRTPEEVDYDTLNQSLFALIERLKLTVASKEPVYGPVPVTVAKIEFASSGKVNGTPTAWQSYPSDSQHTSTQSQTWD